MGYPAVYRNFVLPLHCLLRRRSTLRWYDIATRQEKMSRDELAALQHKKLSALVRHCAKHVPYYRELFRIRGLDPQRVENLCTLRKAGIRLSKQDVRSAGDALLSETSSKRHLFKMTTSGSTGVPLCFYKSLDTECRRQAIKFRAEDWIGKPIGTRTTLIWGRLPPPNLHSRLGRWLYWRYRNYQFLSAFDIGPQQLADYLQRMSGFGTEFIESYVTAAYQMARVMSERKIPPPPNLRGIIVGAEQLVEEQRELIEASFGCPVYNRYGSTEFTNIASECAVRQGLHINSDHILVEVVDENDQPVLDQLGEIVVTDLDSYDMPLIRYRIGDRGIMSSQRCACGRPFAMLRSINGRVSERLITHSGREIHDMYFLHRLMRISGVGKFQVIQKTLDLVQVNLEPDGGISREVIAAQIQAALAELENEQIKVEIVFVDAIPLSSAGKLRHFICEFAPT
jgi:phenylacetate-CoA ligase